LLPRRTQIGPAQLKCRNKGKAVIVRIGSINPDRGGSHGAATPWPRKVVSALALLASLAALTLVLESQYGQLLLGGSLQAVDAATADESDRGAAGGKPVATLTPVEESRHRAVSEYVAKRYRVSQEVALDLVGQAHRVGKELQLDPLLIIAVIAVESSFNPIAESVAGAKGLMQIIPKYHTEKFQAFGGAETVFDPATNIRVGAQILKEYIRYTGNVGIALQMYAGALGDNEDQYTNKVMGMKQRLQYVVAQTPANRPAASVAVRTASARNNSAFPLD
jgi:soluble lytic murein transglycosylase-like protein